MRSVSKAVPNINPAARMQDKIARRQIIRMIGWGTMLTVAVNMMNGHETDFRMVIDKKNAKGKVVGKRYNSNFVRIIGKNRDYSVFGPMDSMLRFITNAVLFNIKDSFETVANNPMVTATFDLFENERFGGVPIVDANIEEPGILDHAGNAALFGGYLFEQTLPFATDEATNIASSAIKNAVSGQAAGVAQDFGDALGEIIGAKSSPKSKAELEELIKNADPVRDANDIDYWEGVLEAREEERNKFKKDVSGYPEKSQAQKDRIQEQKDAAK